MGEGWSGERERYDERKELREENGDRRVFQLSECDNSHRRFCTE